MPRLVLTAKAQGLNTLRLTVTYDPVDILAALDEGASQGKPAVTGLCASGVLSLTPSARAVQCLGTLRYVALRGVSARLACVAFFSFLLGVL